MPADKIPVLFISRRDSLRSVLARACMLHVGHGRFAVHSCGVPGEIAGAAHPAALGALAQARIAVPAHHPQSWDAMRRASSAAVRFVIVLDKPAAAALPALPHQPDFAVWAHPDLLADGDPPADVVRQVLLSLRRRIEIFANLSVRKASREAMRQDIQDLGQV